MSMVASGAWFTWPAPLMPRLLSDHSPVPLTPDQASWMVSCIELGSVIAPFPAMFIANRFGRKICILLGAPLFFIGLVLTVYVKNAAALCAARAIEGLAMSLPYTILPLYLGEVASPDARGAITSLFHIAWGLGCLFPYCVGPFLSYEDLTYVTFSLTVLFVLCLATQPESPYFYAIKGNEEKTIAVLKRLRDSPTESSLKEELNDIEMEVKQDLEEKGSWKDVIETSEDRRALLLLIIVGVVSFLSGQNAILTYTTETFSNIPDSFIQPDYITLIVGFVALIGSVFSIFASDRYGRRFLLLMSSVGCTFTLFAASAYFYLYYETEFDVSSYNWVAPVAIIGYNLFVTAGMHPVCCTYTSELFPTKTRATAASISGINQCFCSFLVLKTYETISSLFGVYFIFFIYGMTCFIGTFLFYFMMPETKASMGVFASAGVFGWINPILPHLLSQESEVQMTSEQASWMITMPEFGNLLSPLPAGLIADKYGRKIVIISCAPMFFIGWVIILYFKTVLAMNVARFIHGLGIGIVYTVIPIYLGEIAAPKYRGTITSLFYCLWWFGFLFEYFFGTLLSYFNFTCLTASANIVFFIAFVCQPESPYFYLMKNQKDRAEKSLLWFRSVSREDSIRELEKMQENVEEDQNKNTTCMELVATSADRKVLLIICAVVTLRQFTGLIPLSIFSTQTLSLVGGPQLISPNNVTLGMGILMFLGSICSSLTLDTFGRRSLLFISCSISAMAMFSAGTFYYLLIENIVNVSSFNWVPPISLLILSGVSVVGIFPVSITYMSELFTSNTRGVGSAFSSVYSTVLGVFILKFYMNVLGRFGVYVNFYIFAAFGMIGAFLSVILMPETKGKMFSEIRRGM